MADKPSKPQVLIGFSKGASDYAARVQKSLDSQWETDSVVENQVLTQIGKDKIDDLLANLASSAFGVYVFAAQDLTLDGTTESSTALNKCIFDLGLFIGKLGKNNFFVLMPKGSSLPPLPYDLPENHKLTFDLEKTKIDAAIGQACNEIGRLIQNEQQLKLKAVVDAQDPREPVSTHTSQSSPSEPVAKTTDPNETLSGNDFDRTYRWLLETNENDRKLLTQIGQERWNKLEIEALLGNDADDVIFNLTDKKYILLVDIGDEIEYALTSKGKKWNVVYREHLLACKHTAKTNP